VTQHALADYVRILARGKNASRNMTSEEAQFTMSEMLAGRYEDVQLGAIFMLLRVLEETPDEIAGFAYPPDGKKQRVYHCCTDPVAALPRRCVY